MATVIITQFAEHYENPQTDDGRKTFNITYSEFRRRHYGMTEARLKSLIGESVKGAEMNRKGVCKIAFSVDAEMRKNGEIPSSVDKHIIISRRMNLISRGDTLYASIDEDYGKD